MTPAVAAETPPMPLSSALPASEVRCWMTARRSLVSSSGSPRWSASGRSAEGGLLGVVEVEHLGQQDRPELGQRRPHRDGDAAVAQRQELHRVRGRDPVVAGVGRAGGDLVARLARAGHAGQVALDVGEQHRDAGVGQLPGQALQRLGLAGAGRAGDETVPVQHRERDAHARRRVHLAADDDGAELERGTVRGISGGDGAGRCVVSHGASLGHSPDGDGRGSRRSRRRHLGCGDDRSAGVDRLRDDRAGSGLRRPDRDRGTGHRRRPQHPRRGRRRGDRL
ncbi:hypothetical protein L7F22_014999 [Adiantum nelumboides]|nr:hypothetical protein [Adiantum nelumboides]